jgi:hypothetical protein
MMGEWIPEATQADREAHKAAHPEWFGGLRTADAPGLELDERTREIRYVAKGRLLTYAQDQGILNTVSEDYQLDVAPDLERTARIARSMGLLVNITFEPKVE